MDLKVACILRHMEPGWQIDDREHINNKKDELRKDLAEMRRLADILVKSRVTERSRLERRKDKEVWKDLQTLMSFDAPRIVRSLMSGWESVLEECVQHDLEVLSDNEKRGKMITATSDFGSAKNQTPTRYEIDLAVNDELRYWAEYECSRFKKSFGSGANENWKPYLEMLVESRIKSCLSPTSLMTVVKLDSNSVSTNQTATVLIRANATPENKIIMEIRGGKLDRASEKLYAEVYAEFAGESEKPSTFKLWQKRESLTASVWRRLSKESRSDRPFIIQEVAALLNAFSNQLPTIADIKQRILAYEDGSTILLKAIVDNETEMRNEKDKDQIKSKLLAIFNNSSMEHLNRYSIIALDSFGIKKTDKFRDIILERFRKIISKSQNYKDIIAFFETIKPFYKKLPPTWEIAEEGIKWFKPVGELSTDVAFVFRSLLLNDTNLKHDLTPLLNAVLDNEIFKISDFRQFAQCVNKLRPLIKPSVNVKFSAEKLLNKLVAKIAKEKPEWDPGVWLAADDDSNDVHNFLEDLIKFKIIVDFFNKNGVKIIKWSLKEFDILVEPLPRQSDKEFPIRYPSRLLDIAYLWLSSPDAYSNEDLLGYEETVLSWRFDNFLLSEKEEGDAEFKRLGSWLKRSNKIRDNSNKSFLIVVNQTISNFMLYDNDTKKWEKAFSRIQKMDMLDRLGETRFEHIRRLLELKPWKAEFSDEWEAWMLKTITQRDYEWDVIFNGIVLQGILFHENWKPWAKIKTIETSNQRNEDIWKSCLNKFDARIKEGLYDDTGNTLERLDRLARRALEDNFLLYKEYNLFFSKYKNIISDSNKALLYSALIRPEDHLENQHLKTILTVLYPAISSTFLLDKSEEAMNRFLSLLKKKEIHFLITKSMKESTAKRIVSRIESSSKAQLESLDLLVDLIFNNKEDQKLWSTIHQLKSRKLKVRLSKIFFFNTEKERMEKLKKMALAIFRSRKKYEVSKTDAELLAKYYLELQSY